MTHNVFDSGNLLVGNYVAQVDGASADSIYLLQSNYRQALRSGKLIRIETSFYMGGANSHAFVGFGDYSGGWALSQAVE